jgi:flagellar motor switch protein FliN/FliY
MSEMLTQEEIDALLSGPKDTTSPSQQESNSLQTAAEKNKNDLISPIEEDALGEIANISMGTAATTFSQLLGKRVQITTPKVDVVTARQIIEEFPKPHVLIHVQYKQGLEGSNLLILSREDGSVIVDLMMGGAGLNPTTELNEMQISGIAEAMNQMMGSAATSMSAVFNSVVDITPPQVIADIPENEEGAIINIFRGEDLFVRIAFKMQVEGIIDSILLQVIPLSVAKSMSSTLLASMNDSKSSEVAQTNGLTRENLSMTVSENQKPAKASQKHEAAKPKKVDYTTEVQPVRFSQLISENPAGLNNHLELIYDVPLNVSVELGRASKTIREILELGPGSVVELDRLAGEPVDMIVNGKLIAKCEVVVINETFGIRITEIVNEDERIGTLN